MPLHNHFFAYEDASQNADDVPSPQMTQLRSDTKQPDPQFHPLLTPDPPAPSSLNANKETRTLVYTCILTTFFFFVELIGGYFAGSLAIMSDAAHLLSDLAGFAISLIAVSVSRLPPNAQMSFGFARAEVLGAFVSMLFIWALTVVLVVFAVERLFNPRPVNGPLMLFLGIIGLLVNVVLGCVLGHSHDHSHDHSHAHSHAHSHSHKEQPPFHTNNPDTNDYVAIPDSQLLQDPPHPHPPHDSTNPQEHNHSHHSPEHNPPSPQNKTWRKILFGNDHASVNIRAAYLHVLGDALQNVGVIVAAIVLSVKPSWSFIDPLCTLLFAIIVLMTTKGLAKETMTVLMEGTPASVDLNEIHEKLLKLEGVSKVGDLHAWSITARRPALSVHLYRQNVAAGHDLVKDVQKILARSFGIYHATIQVNCETAECCDDIVAFAADSSTTNCVSYRKQNGNGSDN